jgi:hypothetical protein
VATSLHVGPSPALSRYPFVKRYHATIYFLPIADMIRDTTSRSSAWVLISLALMFWLVLCPFLFVAYFPSLNFFYLIFLPLHHCTNCISCLLPRFNTPPPPRPGCGHPHLPLAPFL